MEYLVTDASRYKSGFGQLVSHSCSVLKG
jgi:hypothetical protein